MAKSGFVLPIVPGKEDSLEGYAEQMRQRMPEYEESRRNAGVTLERVYLQRNPDGTNLIVIYGESTKDPTEVVAAFASSGLAFDEWFLDMNQEVTGVDIRVPPPGDPAEHIGSWEAPDGRRAAGFALAVPVQPGKEEQGRQFAKEAFEERRDELTKSRLALGSTREEVFLNHTPMGDITVVYIEATDPMKANQGFAASSEPFDRWFKDGLKQIFPPYIDFDQPVPPNEQVWDWRAGG